MTDPNAPKDASKDVPKGAPQGGPQDAAQDVLRDLLADLTAESAVLDALVADLPAAGWARPTPAEGWTVAHQIAHLAWTDDWTVRATRDGEAFTADAGAAFGDLLAAGRDPVDEGAAAGAADEPATLLARWRTGRDEVHAALAATPADVKLPWFGPPMKPASMATARLMETWAHGQDVADALGVTREPSARLRHIAHLGLRTLGFAFTLHGLPAPQNPVRLELTAPDGTSWTFGPPDAPDVVRGPALDFCLLVTQRRHRDDLALTATGPTATAWLPIAQAFAGTPGKGRGPATGG
ncbi:TIGR03084 family metal-binding protein [Streptomyces sp. SP17BM10]|uniref:TIGR03084 family metal-binding protein n=1 Tax=Streptomyces sp. SP17BM10 TaxID=3002530 RepID=UPI002E794D51|nr:TIGR03084 family metal-binding protein [Streptomyces sp. SP17BM10]MEE1782503.1 TIGR03084 family metal-binding protein [Streptomyces sp. SP17BM10]